MSIIVYKCLIFLVNLNEFTNIYKFLRKNFSGSLEYEFCDTTERKNKDWTLPSISRLYSIFVLSIISY